MRQKLFFVIAFMGVLGLLGLTPAGASHTNNDKDPGNDPIHEDQPRPPVEQPGGTCVVEGTVHINNEHGSGGVSLQNQTVDPAAQKDHNHFRFAEDVVIVCTGLTNFDGSYVVDAAGGTDGPGECDPAELGKDAKCKDETDPDWVNHGEELTAGWSHGDGYAGDGVDSLFKEAPDDIYDGTNVNPPGTPGQTCSAGPAGPTCNLNEIVVERTEDGAKSCQGVDPADPDTESCENWLKFCRGLHDDNGNGEPDCQNVTDNAGMPTGGTHVSTGGGNVLAWGALTDWSHPTKPKSTVLCFLADLELEPDRFKDLNGDGVPDKADRARLEGVAQTWTGATKDDCDGKKN